MITTARALAGVDAKALSDEECLAMVDDIEAARRSLDAASAGVLAEVDRRGLCDIRYGTATGVWFERRHGRSRTAVNREIRKPVGVCEQISTSCSKRPVVARSPSNVRRSSPLGSTTATRTRSVQHNTRC
ncbi:MAG: hypothetical protein M5U19_12370 [Microthrixaceae bacterium]|nr:hypothetical protein [Microthrixaceae bacterium]